MNNWLIEWLIDWLVDWLIDWPYTIHHSQIRVGHFWPIFESNRDAAHLADSSNVERKLDQPTSQSFRPADYHSQICINPTSFWLHPVVVSVDQAINQLINQSINQSVAQSDHRSHIFGKFSMTSISPAQVQTIIDALADSGRKERWFNHIYRECNAQNVLGEGAFVEYDHTTSIVVTNRLWHHTLHGTWVTNH